MVNTLKKNNKTEWFAFCVFCVLFIVVSCYHEPWFDEAQAWQIAKCASIREIIFDIPHYEGHLPLWHLLLVVPAKIGISFEVGLKVVSAIPTVCVAYLLMFRAPFSRWIRLLLPFNYFIFYQYGIVSRPYGIMALAFLFLAMSFQKKESHPWMFAGSLFLLAMTSAYGIVMAGTITLCWGMDVYKIVKEKKGECLRNNKCAKIIVIVLVVLVVLCIGIMPRYDTYAMGLSSNNSVITRLLYTCAAIIPDCFVSQILSGNSGVRFASLPLPTLLLGVFIGVAFLIISFILSGKKIGKYFLIPFFVFGVFSTIVYCSSHHIGIVVLLIIFWSWINQEDDSRKDKCKLICPKILLQNVYKRWMVFFLKILFCIGFVVPIWWTVFAGIADIRYPYCHGRETACFLKESGLENEDILVYWNVTREEKEKQGDFYTDMDTNHVGISSEINAYFNRNLFTNLNNGKSQYAYLLHKKATKKENIDNLDKWRNKGYPGVVFDPSSLCILFGESEKIPRYFPVYKMRSSEVSVWKSDYKGEERGNYSYLFLREDLLKKYNLSSLQ